MRLSQVKLTKSGKVSQIVQMQGTEIEVEGYTKRCTEQSRSVRD